MQKIKGISKNQTSKSSIEMFSLYSLSVGGSGTYGVGNPFSRIQFFYVCRKFLSLNGSQQSKESHKSYLVEDSRLFLARVHRL